ncbi:MAG: E3 ubiquitin-protein ligase SspH1 [Chlamydiae bacterium]|nr:E3 ubiquitin-protein ligase SspH1 [Chlamydiota bacterium]
MTRVSSSNISIQTLSGEVESTDATQFSALDNIHSPLKDRTVSIVPSSSDEKPGFDSLPDELLLKILGNLQTPPEKKALPTVTYRPFRGLAKLLSKLSKVMRKVFGLISHKSIAPPKNEIRLSLVSKGINRIRSDYSLWKEIAEDYGISLNSLILKGNDIQEECQKQISKIILAEVKRRVSFLSDSLPIKREMLARLEKPISKALLREVIELRDTYTVYTTLARNKGIFKTLPKLENVSLEKHREELDKWFNDYLAKLSTIEDLNFSDKQLSILPESITKLRALKSLNLNWNSFSRVPESIGNLTTLTWLELKGNKLTDLPNSLIGLKSLTDLELSNNKLSSLPIWIKEFPKLSHIYLQNNRFTSIPKCIEKSKSLRKVILEGNPIKAE